MTRSSDAPKSKNHVQYYKNMYHYFTNLFVDDPSVMFPTMLVLPILHFFTLKNWKLNFTRLFKIYFLKEKKKKISQRFKYETKYSTSWTCWWNQIISFTFDFRFSWQWSWRVGTLCSSQTAIHLGGTYCQVASWFHA